MFRFLGRFWPLLISSVVAFLIGSASSTLTTYVGLRTDAAALAARVTIEDDRITAIERDVSDWRQEDQAANQAILVQLTKTQDLLTELRIRIGPRR